MGHLALTHVSKTSLSDQENNGRALVALDLAGALPKRGEYDQYLIRVMGLPYGATLSAGRNNGDQSWTLRVDQLPGLDYCATAATFPDHCLSVRIIGMIGDDEAVVIGQFELTVTADGRTPTLPTDELDASATQHIDLTTFQSRRARRTGAAAMTEWNLLGITSHKPPSFDSFERLGDLVSEIIDAEPRRTILQRIVRECHARLAELDPAISDVDNVVQLQSGFAG